MYRRHGRNSRNTVDRFDNYSEIKARFDSTGACGHEIKTGATIGYHRGLKKARCTACWLRWCAENAEADHLESTVHWL